MVEMSSASPPVLSRSLLLVFFLPFSSVIQFSNGLPASAPSSPSSSPTGMVSGPGAMEQWKAGQGPLESLEESLELELQSRDPSSLNHVISYNSTAAATSNRPALAVLLGEAIGDYFFRTVHALLTRAVYSLEEDHVISTLLRCQINSIECFVDQRYDSIGLRLCTKDLCSCMNHALPDLGSPNDSLLLNKPKILP